MKKAITMVLVVVFLLAMLSACAPAATTSGAASDAQPKTNDGKKEVYVWAMLLNSYPMFVNNDYIGMDLAAKELGVEVKKIGPQDVDLPAMVAAIQQEISKKPAGMMIPGADASLGAVIDEVMDAGIPVVTVDADVPKSKRLCFVGTDWYQLGYEQAKAAAPFIKDAGAKKAVCIGLPGADNNTSAMNGYIAAMKEFAPNIEVVLPEYASQSNAQKVTETISNLIKSDPSIITVAGFDGTTGPGIAQAIKETNMVGKVFGTCVDAETEQLQGVKDGALVAAVGQKRIFFTYYGVKMLYDYNHNNVKFTDDDKAAGITPIPPEITTGLIIVNKDNVDLMLASAAKKK